MKEQRENEQRRNGGGREEWWEEEWTCAVGSTQRNEHRSAVSTTNSPVTLPHSTTL